MHRGDRSVHRAAKVVTAGLFGTLLLAACGGTPGDPGASSPPARGEAVDVLYAGSLIGLMEQTLGPSFSSESGYQFVGTAGGSAELAQEIEGRVLSGDVFISASSDVDATLEGAAHGNWVSWYVTFARVPLVLAYNPQSPFARAMRKEPWYKVVTSPGFRIGRTDPALDPKGLLAVQAVHQTAARTGARALLRIVADPGNVFPEETLLGRLETGQLDAGFFYLDEARAAGVPTLSLAPVSLTTTFTATILAHARDERGALAFVRFLLGPRARPVLMSAGLELVDPPQVHGPGAPAALLGAILRR
jgi:molybdate/tungstate transport system substrate-binding protein